MQLFTRCSFLLVLGATLVLGSGMPAAADSEMLPANQDDGVAAIAAAATQGQLEPLVYAIYTQHNMAPFWVGVDGPTDRAEFLLNTLRTSYQDGLLPADYRVTAITALWGDRSIEGLARLDVLLSLGLAQYLTDLHMGRTGSSMQQPKLVGALPLSGENLATLIRQGLTSTHLQEFLAAQLPQHEAYLGLKIALAKYRALADQGGWNPIPSGPSIRPGTRDPRLAEIARRLIMDGDLESGVPFSLMTYGEPLLSAVKQFQRRHGHRANGVLDAETIDLLNIPVEQVISRILVNMERLRWLPRHLSGKRILVNIAGFHLFGTEDENLQLDMPVIVGDVYSETPVLSDRIRYIVLNPYWTIPPGIAERETLPRQMADPEYLRSKGIRIFENWQQEAREIDPDIIDWATLGRGIRNFRLRQDPGPDNALGQLKFMFPNSHNIYLHDTPAHDLFSYSNRTFSHGCIRLSDPVALAVYLLAGTSNALDARQIQAMLATGERRVIHLRQPIPVHLLYQTAEADPMTGRLRLYPDVYGRDKTLANTLFSNHNKDLMASGPRKPGP